MSQHDTPLLSGMRVVEASAFVAAPLGGMTLVDEDQAQALYAAMGPAREISGGSAANTLAGLSALGMQCAFVGQVADDQLGQVFAWMLALEMATLSVATLIHS